MGSTHSGSTCVDYVESETSVRGEGVKVPAEMSIVVRNSGPLGRKVCPVHGRNTSGNAEGGAAVGCQILIMDIDEGD